MIEVLKAQSAGFCAGVRRVFALAEEAVCSWQEEKGKSSDAAGDLYSLGPIVHNEDVVRYFEERGLRVADSLNDIPAGGKVIVRSHGVGPQVKKEAAERGIEIIDGTCPLVERVQKLAAVLAAEGFQVVIVGEKEHPEVKALLEWTGGQAIVVADAKEAQAVNEYDRLGLVCQTTQREENYREVGAVLLNKARELRAYNTICKATRLRQAEASELARQVEAMVVVGSHSSANCRQLARVCFASGTPTYFVENASQLDLEWLRGKQRVGVTAGASTPEWIIEEVIGKMLEMGAEKEQVQMLEAKPEGDSSQLKEAAAGEAEDGRDLMTEAMEAQLTKDLPDLRQGSVIRGKVVLVKEDEVLVDVGGKSEGVIPLRELSNRNIASARDVVRVGDEIEVVVVRAENDEGTMILSKRRADQLRAWEKLEDAFRNGTELRGEVIQVVKGGLLVDVGIRGFVPASQVERNYVGNLDKYLGKELRLRVIDLDRAKNKAVLSQKAILEEEYERASRELWETIEAGQRRRGVVRRLTNFGAFVDLGGADGLLHISEMSWTHVNHPSEVVQEGDEIEVFVLSVDKEKQKISLGLKQILPSPWQLAASKYEQGQIVTGRVVRTVPFGAFVQIEPGVEGLVHISQLASYRVARAEDVVNAGDEIPVKILDFRPEEQRMSLSLSKAREELEYQAQDPS